MIRSITIFVKYLISHLTSQQKTADHLELMFWTTMAIPCAVIYVFMYCYVIHPFFSFIVAEFWKRVQPNQLWIIILASTIVLFTCVFCLIFWFLNSHHVVKQKEVTPVDLICLFIYNQEVKTLFMC